MAKKIQPKKNIEESEIDKESGTQDSVAEDASAEDSITGICLISFGGLYSGQMGQKITLPYSVFKGLEKAKYVKEI